MSGRFPVFCRCSQIPDPDLDGLKCWQMDTVGGEWAESEGDGERRRVASE